MECILDDGGEHAVQLDARESDCWDGPASYFREKCQQIVEDMAARGRAGDATLYDAHGDRWGSLRLRASCRVRTDDAPAA